MAAILLSQQARWRAALTRLASSFRQSAAALTRADLGMKVLSLPAPRPTAVPAAIFGPARMLNRELSCLSFNARVLRQATDARLSLLERVKFLAISDSNLDEFLMKRVGRLLQRIEAADTSLSPDGLSAMPELPACRTAVMRMIDAQVGVLANLTPLLAEAGVRLDSAGALDGKAQKALRKLVRTQILPLLTPQAIDRAHPFPFIANLSLNLLLRLRPRDGGEAILARVELPVGVDAPRHLAVGDALVRIEDAVLANAGLLLPGLEVLESGLFRLVRSVSLDIDSDENVDMTALVESELRIRRFAPIVAIRICDGMSDALKAALRQYLAVEPDRLIAAPEAAVGLGDLMALLRLPRPEMRDPPHAPRENPALCRAPDIFRTISKAGTILLRRPYENFATSVRRLVQEASRDPAVRTIKMTLYRAESDSPLVAALIDAARRGKEVVVVIELKARFDEAANLRRSKALREAGAQVSHGALGLKTHCKTILVMRREKGKCILTPIWAPATIMAAPRAFTATSAC